LKKQKPHPSNQKHFNYEFISKTEGVEKNLRLCFGYVCFANERYSRPIKKEIIVPVRYARLLYCNSSQQGSNSDKKKMCRNLLYTETEGPRNLVLGYQSDLYCTAFQVFIDVLHEPNSLEKEPVGFLSYDEIKNVMNYWTVAIMAPGILTDYNTNFADHSGLNAGIVGSNPI
jgi:hypothetical protein